MQGLDIGSQHGSNYGPLDNIPDLGPQSHSGPDLNFENIESTLPPPPQHDGSHSWYDTDL